MADTYVCHHCKRGFPAPHQVVKHFKNCPELTEEEDGEEHTRLYP